MLRSLLRRLPSAFTRLDRLFALRSRYATPRPARLHAEPLEARVVPAGPAAFAVGAGPGVAAQVRMFDADGLPVREFAPYDRAFTGGVRAAMADLTGDGVPDLVTAPGPGGGPHVRAFDGATGREFLSFFAYEESFRGGVTVAAGPVGDGRIGIATGADAGGGPRVRVFDVRGAVVNEFFAYESGFAGGVRVALATGWGDSGVVFTAPGVGGGPRVCGFDAATGAVEMDAMAYDESFRGGVAVMAGDLTGDGMGEVVTTPGMGGGPHVRAFDCATEGMAAKTEPANV